MGIKRRAACDQITVLNLLLYQSENAFFYGISCSNDKTGAEVHLPGSSFGFLLPEQYRRRASWDSGRTLVRTTKNRRKPQKIRLVFVFSTLQKQVLTHPSSPPLPPKVQSCSTEAALFSWLVSGHKMHNYGIVGGRIHSSVN